MPNGYTIDIFKDKDVTLNDYVWRCARSFGALYLRDVDTNLPLPVYYADELAKAHRRLGIAHALDEVRAKALADEEYRVELKDVENHLHEKEAIQRRYEGMLEEVFDWDPPTSDHEGLKTFMIEQLVESIRFDCAGTFYEDMVARVKARGVLTGEEYIKREIERAEAAIAHYTKMVQAGSKLSQDKSSAWVTDLRESLEDATEVDLREDGEGAMAKQAKQMGEVHYTNPTSDEFKRAVEQQQQRDESPES